MPLAPVVVHVARRYDAKSCEIGDVFQRSREGEVSPDVVPLQLDDKVLLPEHRTAPLGEAAGSGQAVAPQHPREETVAASRPHEEAPAPGVERRRLEPPT